MLVCEKQKELDLVIFYLKETEDTNKKDNHENLLITKVFNDDFVHVWFVHHKFVKQYSMHPYNDQNIVLYISKAEQ